MQGIGFAVVALVWRPIDSASYELRKMRRRLRRKLRKAGWY